MLDLIRNNSPSRPVRLLDFGCGAAHLYEYMRDHGVSDVEYAGLDLSEKFVELSRRKFPSTTFFCGDVLKQKEMIPTFDYVVMNGVFTEKRGLSFEDMFDYFKRLVRQVWEKVDHGMAFNLMSKHVDWERDDLFHLAFDTVGDFLTKEISRNFVIRNDYGLYEYTPYVYRR